MSLRARRARTADARDAFQSGEVDMIGVTQTSSAQLGPGGHWRNWVGNQSFITRHKAEPGSEDELAALVREASRQNLSIRVAGSGHSFTPIVATSGLLLSLTNMHGLVSADLDRKRVVVRAGTRIGIIGRALKEIGLSLANQGDIDTQAIAGALDRRCSRTWTIPTRNAMRAKDFDAKPRARAQPIRPPN